MQVDSSKKNKAMVGKLQTCTIAELSRSTGFSYDSIRYYEKIGLLPPAKHKKNGQKEYDQKEYDQGRKAGAEPGAEAEEELKQKLEEINDVKR
ncbi:hypothetical protein AWM70_14470 [Paenibacillus yonginensis]|uniref:HTH merR-type domain-containing protein n=2 Tax=Paenibacillus yonginensis TaxID=1462996 RepID=A0A1B1N2L0_9BACL|nr:hypothetical protein AWM70_14470 [Paenibacillus yonginensis]